MREREREREREKKKKGQWKKPLKRGVTPLYEIETNVRRVVYLFLARISFFVETKGWVVYFHKAFAEHHSKHNIFLRKLLIIYFSFYYRIQQRSCRHGLLLMVSHTAPPQPHLCKTKRKNGLNQLFKCN